MDLKQLRTFVMVAECGSLSGASDRLRIAQPALSRQIKLLEGEIGFDLFTRSTRGMMLTERGSAMMARMAGLVRQIDDTIDDVRAMGDQPTGQVVLGCIPSASYMVAARIAMRVARELPGVALRILEGYAGHQIDWLQRGEVDLALLYGPAADLHLRVTHVMYEELVLVSPADAAPRRGKLAVADLGALDLVLPSRPHGLRLVVENAAAKAGVALNVRYEADSFVVLKELVSGGLGHTILPLSAFYREQADGRYRITRLHGPHVARELVLARPASRNDTRATAAVTALALDEIAQMLASGQWQTGPQTGP